MDRMLSIGIVGAAFAVLALVVFYGPLVAAFMVAGVAFALMVGMMTVAAVHAFDQWRQGHGWTVRQKTP
jgi:hypothetical protein